MKTFFSSRKTTALLAFLLLTLCGFIPASAAETSSVRTIKAGFFSFPGYHQQQMGIRSGYGYDFLVLLQRYTRLNVEYVGYENTWEEMQQMLLDGRIDVLTSARKTLEREKIFDFSMPIGLNSVQINVRKDDERFIPGDYAALNGITIGILAGNSRNSDTEKFAEEKGFTYKTKEFSNVEALKKALIAGNVDAIATSSLRKSSEEKTIAEFAPQKFYAIVRKGETALLNEINYGIGQMDLYEGNWQDDLYYKNYIAKAESILTFTQRELAYIHAVQNGEKKITVTARPDRAPYSFVNDDGKLVGILPDYFAKLMEKAGLPYTVLVAKDREEYGEWQSTHRTDVIIDYHYDASLPWSDDTGLFTSNYMELTLARVVKKGFAGEVKVIARIATQPVKDIREADEGDRQIIEVETADDALIAVRDDRVEACVVPSFIAEKFINSDPGCNLTYSILKEPIHYSTIRINPETDHELCSILNKCIVTERAGILSEFVTKYTTVSFKNLTLAQYLKLHPQLVLLMVGVLFLLLATIAFFIFKGIIDKMRAEQLMTRLKHQQELEAALEESKRINKKMDEANRHEKLKGDAFSFMLNNDNLETFVDFFSERILELYGCDQVIYRDIEGRQILKERPGTKPLDFSLCENCPHFAFEAPVYEDGFTAMDDCKVGYKGIPVHPDCRVRASLTYLVHEDKKVFGYIALHYLDGTHKFSEEEKNTFDRLAKFMSMVLSRRKQQNALKKAVAFTNCFISTFVSTYSVDLDTCTCKVYKRTDKLAKDYPDVSNYLTNIKEYIDKDVHPDDRAALLEFIQPDNLKRLLKDQPMVTHVYRDITDGVEKIYRVRIVKGDDENTAAFAFSDITEETERQNKQQKQLEEALAMAQSANRAKTTFLNNMSHDIRTPMNAIIGFTGLAASHINNKEQVQDYLTKIGQSSDHLLSLINDVLDMSRIESGKMNLDEKEENLPAIIHTLRDIVQADIRAKQHDFFIDTVNVNDENIICDKLRLNQVLLNILSNAIKYTANGGTISMRITEKAMKPSGYATYEFCIKDNGMGMDEEFQKTIFDPFTRVKSSTVSGIQGTGLGMAITKNIIDMMGGTINIHSTPGKGTQMIVTFDFRLIGAPKELTEIPELKGLRGLVVDDDADTCMSITGMIRDIGMRDEWCVSGKEAVLRAAEAYRIGDNFKVYIIDWLMPDMNGIETTRRIRKVIGDDTPIIILTAYDWSDIEAEAHEAGVTAFVSKPMFPSDLHRVLNHCLGKPDPKENAPEDDFDFTGKKVLLVEDNALNREIAVELLSEYGFIIYTAEDGTIAVNMMKDAKDGDYDVILMDVQMPIMNGYDATRAIRALGTPISKIPILAMTADAFAEDRRLAIEAGMNDHITKPINISVLRQTLAKYL